MGIYDRDYWKDRHNKKAAYTEKAAFRNPSADDDLSGHAYFNQPSAPKFSAWQVIIYIFAFFGFIDWVKIVTKIALRFL